MRQGAPSKRGRGRSGGGGGRRGYSNPLNRTYDSSGPEVKVRGTALHIYDKYQALARDAQSSGDHIASENFLQHAEHYYRILASHNAQHLVLGQQYNNNNNNAQGRQQQQAAEVRPDPADQEQPQIPATASQTAAPTDSQPKKNGAARGDSAEFAAGAEAETTQADADATDAPIAPMNGSADVAGMDETESPRPPKRNEPKDRPAREAKRGGPGRRPRRRPVRAANEDQVEKSDEPVETEQNSKVSA